MADKKKIIITNMNTQVTNSFSIQDGGTVTHVGDWIVIYEGSWRSDAPIFKYQLQNGEAYSIVSLSNDEELIEKVKILSESDMTILRNLMEASELL